MGASHQLGLRSLRERLVAAFGPSAALRIERTDDGCRASFHIRATDEGDRRSSRSGR
jgi:sensor histidine kinase YesM